MTCDRGRSPRSFCRKVASVCLLFQLGADLISQARQKRPYTGPTAVLAGPIARNSWHFNPNDRSVDGRLGRTCPKPEVFHKINFVFVTSPPDGSLPGL